jgi:hypothetical protein
MLDVLQVAVSTNIQILCDVTLCLPLEVTFPKATLNDTRTAYGIGLVLITIQFWVMDKRLSP